MITAQQCFVEEGDIPDLAQDIFDWVDFLWMLEPSTQLMRMDGTGDRVSEKRVGKLARTSCSR